jgi:hypothetical protein
MAACASMASAQAAWTLGSPSTLVAKLQGRPRLVERLTSLGYEVWHFGDSWVRLSCVDDRVVGWWNADGALKAELRPRADTTRERAFAVGSTRDDVTRLQGTPTAVEARPELTLLLLRYGTSVVRVSGRDARVMSWEDPGGILRTRPRDVLARDEAPRAPDSGVSAPSDHATRQPTSPPSLSAHVQLAGANGVGVVEAESRAALEVAIWNAGPGTAYGVTVTATTERPTLGLDVGRGERADSIPAGRSATLRVAVATSDALRDGEVAFRVSASEQQGYDLASAARVVLRTRALRPPRLELEGVGVRDQSGNGRIEPREIVDITARVANRGTGSARDVRVTIVAGDDVQLTPESAREVTLGVVRAGETRDVRFSAFTRAGATGFPVSLAVREARPRFDTLIVLPLALDRPLAAMPTLAVRGRDAGASVAPPPLVVDVDTGIPRAPARPNAVAVVLGVERYERAPAVPFARHDAAVFRDYARRIFGIGDDASRLYFRTDDEVTGGELRKVFGDGGWLARRVTPETDVIVYWAGHGQSDLRTRAAYLLPNDADPNYPAQTGLALTELYDRLATLHARSVVVFLDACFSGGMREGGALLSGARGVVVSLEHPALRSETMAVFSAATGEQVASAWPEQQHGVFTYWLLKGLRGEADADGDGALSVDELDRFVRTNVPRSAAMLDREQTPQAVARDRTRTLVLLR